MLSCGIVRNYLILSIWLSVIIMSYGSVMYITNVKCENLDEHFSTINSCFTKRTSRTRSESTVNITLLEKVTSSVTKLEFVKKSNDKYNTYLYKDVTFNACKFIDKRSISPIANYLYTMFEQYTNLNHSCPYEGFLLVDRFRIDVEKVKWIPMPSGDFGVISRWYAQGKERFMLTVYFTFIE